VLSLRAALSLTWWSAREKIYAYLDIKTFK